MIWSCSLPGVSAADFHDQRAGGGKAEVADHDRRRREAGGERAGEVHVVERADALHVAGERDPLCRAIAGDVAVIDQRLGRIVGRADGAKASDIAAEIERQAVGGGERAGAGAAAERGQCERIEHDVVGVEQRERVGADLNGALRAKAVHCRRVSEREIAGGGDRGVDRSRDPQRLGSTSAKFASGWHGEIGQAGDVAAGEFKHPAVEIERAASATLIVCAFRVPPSSVTAV